MLFKEEVIVMSTSYIEQKFAQAFTQSLSACGKTILNSNRRINSNKKITKKSSFQGNWFNTVAIWVQRSRQRKHLARLDQHLLDDIGLTQEMVVKEIAKPFWR